MGKPAVPTPKRVRELPELAKDNSLSYLNDDGSKTDVVSLDRVNYKDASGRFQPIDSTVVVGSDGVLTNRADSWRYRFRDVASGGVEISTAAGSVFSFTPRGGDVGVKPVLVGDHTVLYSSVWPGVDVRYTVSASGLKEDLVLANAKAGGRHEFVLEPPRVLCSLDFVAFGPRARRLSTWDVHRSTHRSCVVERSRR